jgi:thiosulfate/3-mercaptopyruvate sulfurtransferase
MAFTVGDHDLPAPDTLRSLVEELGIVNADRVVLYGETWHVGWLYVALDRVGHGARTTLLDGGLPQWRAEGRPVETGPPPAVARATFAVTPREVVATTEWLRARLGSRRVAVIDVRSRDEYVAGHIPTARHLDWSRTFTQPDSALNNQASLFLSASRLEALFRAAGAAPGKEVVVYCTIGLRASLMYLVAKRLGYQPRFYDGSWSAWSGAGQPVATGTEPGSVR